MKKAKRFNVSLNEIMTKHYRQQIRDLSPEILNDSFLLPECLTQFHTLGSLKITTHSFTPISYR